MNIVALKNVLTDKGILVTGQGLALNTAEDKDGNKTEWMRHWNDDKRVAISIHRDTVALIRANDPKANNLVLQAPEVRQGSKGEYTAYRIVAVTGAEITL